MPIGIIVEGAPGETRVAATPSSVTQLLQLGYKVFVERGADAGSSFPDADYEAAGAWLVDRKTISAARGCPMRGTSLVSRLPTQVVPAAFIAAGAGYFCRRSSIAIGSRRGPRTLSNAG